MTNPPPEKDTKPARKKPVKRPRTPMPTQPVKQRVHNFDEVAVGLTEEQAVREAERCLNCKKRNCVKGCPVEVPIPEFITKIRDKDYGAALELIYQKNVLPAICGRVCPQETQCEQVCTLGKVKDSKPVAIGALERFVADWGRRMCVGNKCEQLPANDKKVAIVGSGPSSLTCAADLAKLGYDVTIFEAFHKLGGVLVYGIPEFRLPKAIVHDELDALLDLGVKFEKNVVVGKLLDFADLKEAGFEAVFLGVGAGLPIFLNIPGTELNGVLSANEFLTRANLMKAYEFPAYDTPIRVGRRVGVIGGGNVAMDSARTALRLGAEEVTVFYRRSEVELPARRAEYEHAVEEGIQFEFLRNPRRVIDDENGNVRAIEVDQMCLGEPDDSGRRRPLVVACMEYEVELDTVIMAIGTRANPLIRQAFPDLAVNKWGYVETDEMGRTNLPNVYAGGDIVTGSATVISAMGAGRAAARAIHEDLS